MTNNRTPKYFTSRTQSDKKVSEVRKKAYDVSYTVKPVAKKGYKTENPNQRVRLFKAKIEGEEYYYYETLNGQFVSAGKNLKHN